MLAAIMTACTQVDSVPSFFVHTIRVLHYVGYVQAVAVNFDLRVTIPLGCYHVKVSSQLRRSLIRRILSSAVGFV